MIKIFLDSVKKRTAIMWWNLSRNQQLVRSSSIELLGHTECFTPELKIK